ENLQEQVHMSLMTCCIQEMRNEAECMPEFKNLRDVTVNGFVASCIEYEVSHQPVSIHIPIWRFAAALFTAPPEIMSNYVCVEESNEISLLSITRDATDRSWETITEVGKRNLNGLCPLLMEMPL